MPVNDAYKYIVRFIKANPGEDEKTILRDYIKSGGMDLPPQQIRTMIMEFDLALIKLRKTETLDESKGIRFQRILDPIPVHKKQAGFWEMYFSTTRISAEIQRITRAMIKKIVKNDIAPRDQGDRGTCVGQAWSEAKDVLYATLNAVLPTDKEQYKKDVTDASGVVHDVLYYPSYSAEDLYQTSRRLGHVTYPSGSCTSCGAKALVQEGIAHEDEWPTSKTPKHVYLKAPTETTRGEHKIDGYTQRTSPSFDDVRKAIEKYGIVVGSFVIYQNYSTMRGGDGTFPDPKGQETGAHAMLCYDYDDNWIYLVHSWGDWCGRLGKMSAKYIQSGCMDIFAPIDATEAARYKETYVKINFMANVRCNFYIDRKYLGTYDPILANEVSGWFQKGKTVGVDAEAIDYYNLHAYENYTPESDGILIMKIQVPPPEPADNWLMRLIKWIRSLLP